MSALLFNIPATGTRASKAKPADVLINRVNRKIAKCRYYLHKQLDRSLFKLNKVTRVIQAPGFKHFTDIPVGQRYYIGQLLELGYKIQYEIF